MPKLERDIQAEHERMAEEAMLEERSTEMATRTNVPQGDWTEPYVERELVYTREEVDAAPFGPQKDELVLRNLQHVYSMGRRNATDVRDARGTHLAGLKAVFDLGKLWGWEDAHDSEGQNA